MRGACYDSGSGDTWWWRYSGKGYGSTHVRSESDDYDDGGIGSLYGTPDEDTVI